MDAKTYRRYPNAEDTRQSKIKPNECHIEFNWGRVPFCDTSIGMKKIRAESGGPEYVHYLSSNTPPRFY